MMPAHDPVGDLVLLVRAAAESGEDWRARLHREWLPRTVATTPRAALIAALSEWSAEPPSPGADLAAMLESAVLDAMADQGYD
jgi:hypothetical protein